MYSKVFSSLSSWNSRSGETSSGSSREVERSVRRWRSGLDLRRNRRVLEQLIRGDRRLRDDGARAVLKPGDVRRGSVAGVWTWIPTSAGRSSMSTSKSSSSAGLDRDVVDDLVGDVVEVRLAGARVGDQALDREREVLDRCSELRGAVIGRDRCAGRALLGLVGDLGPISAGVAKVRLVTMAGRRRGRRCSSALRVLPSPLSRLNAELMWTSAVASASPRRRSTGPFRVAVDVDVGEHDVDGRRSLSMRPLDRFRARLVEGELERGLQVVGEVDVRAVVGAGQVEAAVVGTTVPRAGSPISVARRMWRSVRARRTRRTPR